MPTETQPRTGSDIHPAQPQPIQNSNALVGRAEFEQQEDGAFHDRVCAAYQQFPQYANQGPQLKRELEEERQKVEAWEQELKKKTGFVKRFQPAVCAAQPTTTAQQPIANANAPTAQSQKPGHASLPVSNNAISTPSAINHNNHEGGFSASRFQPFTISEPTKAAAAADFLSTYSNHMARRAASQLQGAQSQLRDGEAEEESGQEQQQPGFISTGNNPFRHLPSAEEHKRSNGPGGQR